AFLLAQTIAITGGTVYPVSGPKLPNASVLIRDGRIVAVGANVSIPPDATRIDAAGKWVTPGLIDGAGQLGLVEISAVPGTRDALEYERRKVDFSRAQIHPLSASAPDLEALLPVLHGRVSLIAYANRRSDIETALRLAKEFKVRLILAGAAEGWEIAAAIAAAGVPVLVETMDNIPGYDSLGIRY